jgi:quercetin dioxygenase-like cupin family protein
MRMSEIETVFDVTAPPVAILREGTPLEVIDQGGNAWAVAWPGTGSRHRSMHRITLDAGGATIALGHPGEAVYFVAHGEGEIDDLHAGVTHPLGAKTMVYVPRGSGYRVSARTPMLVVGGPCPPDVSLYGGGQPLEPRGGEGDGPLELYDAERDGEPVPIIGKQVRLIVWPGTGADVATMNYAVLEPGEQNQPHAHLASDDAIAILAGRGSIDDLSNGVTHDFETGDVVFVSSGVEHMVKADKGVYVVSAGGPCPPDVGMLKALGLV